MWWNYSRNDTISWRQGSGNFPYLMQKKFGKQKKWRRAIFIPIRKKGDLQDCSNYRTISLISHGSKIMLKIILSRMKNKLDQEISKTQAGFWQGRGTRDHILNTRIIIGKYKTDLNCCFIDYSKAFDRAKHHELRQWTNLVCQDI